MWPLVKSDIHYTRTGLFVTGAFVVGLFCLHAVVNGWNFNAFVHSTSTSAMIGIAFIAVSMDSAKRDRALMSLPVSIVGIGVARLVYVLVVFAGLALVWMLFLLARPVQGSLADVWVMINSAAISTVLFLLFAIHQDLGHFNTWRYRLVFYALAALFLATVAALGLAGVLDTWGPKYGALFGSFQGALFHVMLAATLFVMDLRIFARRHSYLS